MRDLPMSDQADDHSGLPDKSLDSSHTPGIAKKPWRAPAVITSAHTTDTAKDPLTHETTTVEFDIFHFGPS
jgi:hypothetical protein